MGIRTLDLDDWLVVDDRFDDELDLKRRLLSERPDDVFAARPEALDASAEVLELDLRLARRPPPRPATTRTGSPPGPLGPDRLPVRVVPRVGRGAPAGCGRADGAGGPLRAARAGRPLSARGGLAVLPVALAAAREARALAGRRSTRRSPTTPRSSRRKVDRFFDRLRADRPVVRRNLSIHSHDDLYRPEPHESPESFAPDAVRHRPVSGSAASARPWCDCPAPARSCSRSRPSSAR